jgi:LmbE family N-acetylglucosaminyl deacetylase
MEGWPSNDAPGAFCKMPVREAAAPLATLMARYEPQVVVTYDDFGFYGHPDHIQTHHVTMAALELSGITAKVYFPTVRRSLLGEFRERVEGAGVELPDVDESRFGAPDEAIAATIDCRAQADAKRAALAAHSSQQENIFFLRFSPSDFSEMFGTEEFIRWMDPTGTPTPEDDLFAGWRDRSAS